MLDDVQVGHYDPNKMRYIPQRSKAPGSENREAEHKNISTVTEFLYTGMKYRAVRLKHCLNQTEGIHVLQRLAKCEIVNGVPGLTVTNNSFNGLQGDDLIYDVHEDSFQVEERWPSECYRTGPEQTKWQIKTMYHPVCIKYLTKYLKEESNLVVRRVKPTVRLLKKTHTNSGEIQVTCLTTGFYPRHINLTLLRDGQPVSEDQITGGILLPNGDDTYQMRKSVEVSAEELRQHSYNCRVTHLSLNTSLDITFGNEH
ncbi:class I histocompatibility antigen, F10 alpha chain-like [Chanos chanos]|uniref:Class I histocompatibility antigen, F10 alpha chain-like n=1 Tax=Chanos chanos TaxID=29144 RepID=A0A6J2UR50_CHACN|nr:class I histocompatibility antigen, F10 alpha chain-like [Chanos chanos]